jgi:hypothetical protein
VQLIATLPRPKPTNAAGSALNILHTTTDRAVTRPCSAVAVGLGQINPRPTRHRSCASQNAAQRGGTSGNGRACVIAADPHL